MAGEASPASGEKGIGCSVSMTARPPNQRIGKPLGRGEQYLTVMNDVCHIVWVQFKNMDAVGFAECMLALCIYQ
jgi:hypothetical protein